MFAVQVSWPSTYLCSPAVTMSTWGEHWNAGEHVASFGRKKCMQHWTKLNTVTGIWMKEVSLVFRYSLSTDVTLIELQVHIHELNWMYWLDVRDHFLPDYRQQRLGVDFQALQGSQQRLKAMLEQCEREIVQRKENERQLGNKNKLLTDKLKAEKDEVRVQKVCVMSTNSLRMNLETQARHWSGIWWSNVLWKLHTKTALGTNKTWSLYTGGLYMQVQ